MTARVGHFAIECEDVERAKAFYEAVFGWPIVPWGPPGYYHIQEAGILGDLRARREGWSAGPGDGVLITVNVENVRETTAAVEKAGGKIAMAEYRIEGVGNLIYFVDTEGNRIGAIQYDGGLAGAPGQMTS